MGFEIKYVEITESTNILYISVQLICATAITNYHQRMFEKSKHFQKIFSAQSLFHTYDKEI